MKPKKGAGEAWRLEVHPELESTSDHLIRLAMQHDSDRLAVVALRQTQGRGQFGRPWHAPEGNLNLSMLVRPRTQLRDAPQWSLAAGVAAAEALHGMVPDLRLKYPNDLMLDGRKLGGILVESAAIEGQIAWLVIGVGINIRTAPNVPEQPTIALAERGAAPAPEALARLLLSRIDAWRAIIETSGFAPVREAWLALAANPEAARPHLRQWETS